MNRPGILFAVLLLLACVAGVALVRIHDANTRPKLPKSSETNGLTGASNGNPTSATEGELLDQAYQIAQTRQLAFPEDVTMGPASVAVIQKAWQNTLQERFPGDSLARMGLAWQLLGILPADEDLVARYRLRSVPSQESYYDPSTGKLLHHPEMDISNEASREWLTHHLILMLLDQNFHWRESQLPLEVNTDQALAQEAISLGDTFWHTLKHTKTDATEAHAWRQLDALTNNWPEPLRAIEFLGMREAVHFCQAVTGQGLALDAIYQQLPTCTAHLLHPDRYLEIPRWQPRRLDWAQLDLRGAEPEWENVVGELLLRTWLQRVLSEGEGALLASAWEGDGFLFYQTDTEAPQLVWKTAWRNEERAQAFLSVLDEHALPLFETDTSERQAEGNRVTFPGILKLTLIREGETVSVFRTTDDAWLEALESLAARSAFTEKKP